MNDTACVETAFNFFQENCVQDPLQFALTLFKTLALGIIILLTICGNVLILMAVALSPNLRSSTHYLIGNCFMGEWPAAFRFTGPSFDACDLFSISNRLNQTKKGTSIPNDSKGKKIQLIVVLYFQLTWPSQICCWAQRYSRSLQASRYLEGKHIIHGTEYVRIVCIHCDLFNALSHTECSLFAFSGKDGKIRKLNIWTHSIIQRFVMVTNNKFSAFDTIRFRLCVVGKRTLDLSVYLPYYSKKGVIAVQFDKWLLWLATDRVGFEKCQQRRLVRVVKYLQEKHVLVWVVACVTWQQIETYRFYLETARSENAILSLLPIQKMRTWSDAEKSRERVFFCGSVVKMNTVCVLHIYFNSGDCGPSGERWNHNNSEQMKEIMTATTAIFLVILITRATLMLVVCKKNAKDGKRIVCRNVCFPLAAVQATFGFAHSSSYTNERASQRSRVLEDKLLANERDFLSYNNFHACSPSQLRRSELQSLELELVGAVEVERSYFVQVTAFRGNNMSDNVYFYHPHARLLTHFTSQHQRRVLFCSSPWDRKSVV